MPLLRLMAAVAIAVSFSVAHASQPRLDPRPTGTSFPATVNPADPRDSREPGDGNADETPPRLDRITPAPSAQVVDGNGLRSIDIGFDEVVVVPAGAVRVWGVLGDDLAISGVVFDPDTRVLTVELVEPVFADVVTVVVDYSITDSAGNPLDGELASAAAPSLPSGDGIQGGRAVLRYRVLRGDADRDGVVDQDDAALVQSMLGQGQGDASFDPRADLNGDGFVNVLDVAIWANGQGTSLPTDVGPAPVVESITPDPTKAILADLAEVRVRYSEPIVRIEPRDLHLISDADDLLVPDRVAIDADGQTMVFGFDAPPARCDRYRVRLSNAVADAFGGLAVRPATTPVLSGIRPTPVPVLDAYPVLVTQEIVTLTGTAMGAAQVRVVGPEDVYVADVVGDRFSVDVELPTDFVHTVSVSALSECGTASSAATAKITRDTSGPMINIDFPALGQDITTDAVTVLGRVGDALSGAMGITVTVNGLPAEVSSTGGNNGTFVAMGVPLTMGSQQITIVATDMLGNSRSRSQIVTRVEVPQGTPIIEVVGGDGQAGPVLGELVMPLSVKLTRPDGMPMVGKVVTFDIERNDGRLAEAPGETTTGGPRVQVFTDSQGIARAYWGLGSTAGAAANRVRVVSNGLVGTAYFCATGERAPASRILVGDMNNQRGEVGTPLAQPLIAYVNDGDAGNPVAGVPVVFSVAQGGGSFTGGDSTATVLTGNDGRAETVFVLGDDAGRNEVEATFDGNPGLPAVFASTGVARVEGQPTTLAGIVLDNANRPIGGALATMTVTLDFASGPDTVILGPVESDVEGRFAFDASVLPADALNDELPGGPAKVLVSGVFATSLDGEPIEREWTFPYVGYDIVLVEGAANGLQDPVWLPELDPANEVFYDGTEDVVLTVAGIEGLEFLVKAGSMTREDGTRPTPADPEVLRLNQVHFDEVPMALPDGNAYPFAWTLQPKNAEFDPPIEVTLPNITGLAAGSIAEILQWNNDVAAFETMGTGRVSADGSVIVSEAGSGITVAGWGGAAPPPPPETELKECPDPTSNGCTLSPDINGFRCVPGGVLASVVIGGCGGVGECVDVSFKTAGCDEHDICYTTCGGPSKSVCDLSFYQNLLAACDSISGLSCNLGAQLECADWAYTYLRGVRTSFGDRAFRRSRADCDDCTDRGTDVFLGVREDAIGIEPPFPDDDRDGIDDRWELENGLDDTNPTDAYLDYDGDELVNATEFLANADPFDPLSLDGLLTDGEVVWGSQPPPPDVLSDGWIVSTLGRDADVGTGGSYSLRVPAGPGVARIRGQVRAKGRDRYWTSDFFDLPDNGQVEPGPGVFSDSPAPSPLRIELLRPAGVIDVGQSLQLVAEAEFPMASSVDVSLRALGTSYIASDDTDVAVDEAGLVVGLRPGTAFVTATNEGATSSLRIDVVSSSVMTQLVGTVLLPDGSPADGAVISSIGYGVLAQTDVRGQFVSAIDLPADAVALSVQATFPGFAETSSGPVHIVADGLSDCGVLQLRPVFDGPLFPGTTSPVGEEPEGIAWADFNDDGHFDLVVTNRDDDDFSLLLGRGDGTFEAEVRYATGRFPWRVVSGDFNGDGVADVAVSNNQNNSVSVRLGTVGGGLSGDQRYPTGTFPRALAAVDIDRDGSLDLIVANWFSDDLSVLRSVGDGSFVAGDRLPVGLEPSGIAFGDFDQNGMTDLAVSNEASGSVSVLLQGLDGGFQSVPPIATGRDPSSIVAGDLNGDGFVELVVTNARDNDASILLGMGGGSFNISNRVSVGPSPRSSQLADVDGDGTLDLVVANGDDEVRVLAGLGDGMFMSPYRLAAGDGPAGIAISDFTRDGLPDAAVVNQGSSRVTMLLGSTDGGLATANPEVQTGDLPSAVASGDIDGDSRPDLVVANRLDDSITVLRAVGPGEFSEGIDIPVGNDPYDIALSDIDNDGDSDVLVLFSQGSAGGGVSVLLNDGLGAFAAQADYSTGINPRRLVIADFDGDGSLDASVANNASRTVSVLSGVGDGTFGPATDYAINGNPWGVQTADVNVDGVADVVVIDTTNDDVLVFLGSSGNQLEPAIPFGVRNLGAEFTITDANNDGWPDLVAIVRNGLRVLVGSGDGAFVEGDFVPLNGSGTWVVSLDANDDGNSDVLVVDTLADGVELFLGNGDGSFAQDRDFAAGNGPVAAAVEDFNDDGFADVAVANEQGDSVSILLNKLGGTREAMSSPRVPAQRQQGVPRNRDAVPSIVSSSERLWPHPLKRVCAGTRQMRQESLGSQRSVRVTLADHDRAFADPMDTARTSSRHRGRRVITAVDPSLGVPRTAIVESDGRRRFLPTLGGPTSRGLAINGRGDIVGVSDTADGRVEGFVWEYASGTIASIGTLDGVSSRATHWLGGNIVLGEASTGETTRAVAWTAESGLVDLNAREADFAGVTLTGVHSVLIDGRAILDAVDSQGVATQVAVRVSLVETLSGDVTRDGRVDEADLIEAIRLVHSGDPAGDLDGNGIVSAQDFALVAQQMGREAKPIEEITPVGAP